MWKKRKFYQDELKGEFRLHRCLFHHYDVIDFTVFEFGMRLTYLVWRVLCLVLIPLLTLSLYKDIMEYKKPHGTPNSSFMYMHMWLAILLTISLVIEVASLIWSFIQYPTCELVCLQNVPCYFQLMWYMYNTIYCNIAACGFMYTSIFSMRKIIGLQYYLFLAIIFYSGIHVSTTAIPSRMAHGLQPLVLVVVHIFATAIYQYSGGTDPHGNKYVYSQMDWANSLESTLTAIIWIIIVFFIHVAMVFASWGRRLIYRRLRKGKEAVMNPDPDDDSSVCSVDADGDYLEDQPSPKIWIEDIPGDPTGHKRVIMESPPPKRSFPSAQNKYLYEVWRDPHAPHYPGEKRKRLVFEPGPQPLNPRYLFAPASPCGSPLPRSYQRSRQGEGRSKEVSFICHPDMSPDGESVVYKCTPETPNLPACYACVDDRYVDRQKYINKLRNMQTPIQDPPEPKHNAYRFRFGPLSTEPFLYPRDRSSRMQTPVDRSLQTLDEPDNEARPILKPAGSRQPSRSGTPVEFSNEGTPSSKPPTAQPSRKSSSRSQPPRYSEVMERTETPKESR